MKIITLKSKIIHYMIAIKRVVLTMFAYKRLEQVFQRLYIEQSYPSEKLAADFSVSKRTIRTDINELNDILENYESKVILRRDTGYTLLKKENVQEVFASIQKPFSNSAQTLETTEDRVRKLLSLLLSTKKELPLDELCNQIFVGRTTILSYIRQLRGTLAPYNLKIVSKINVGYRIEGEEAAIREFIFDQMIHKNFESYISQFSFREYELFKEIKLDELATLVTKYFPPSYYQMTDYNRKNFIIHLAIGILRIKKNYPLDKFSVSIIFDKDIKMKLEQLLKKVEEDYQISFSDNDRKWLYNHLFTNLHYRQQSGDQSLKIYALINQMLAEINNIIGEDLQNDDILRNDLFVHFSYYLKLKESLKDKKNPLLAEIKKNFSYAFELAVLATNNSSWLNKYEFTEDDIGYLALHIAAAVERKNESRGTMKKVLVVCGQGVSTSRLVEAMLKKRFSNQLEIIEIISYATYKTKNLENIDFVVSTVPLKSRKVPIIEIDILDAKKGIDKIEKLLMIEDERQGFLSLFDSSLFINSNQAVSRDELIVSLGLILEERGFVTENFSDKVINREKIAPTNITELIAIPHAIDSFVQKSKIFVYLSKEPINWREEDSVKIIFLLVIAEQDIERFQTFFEYLSDLVEDDTLQQKIASTTSFETFLSALIEK